MATGRFIALEGVDGAGTTTQLERLAAHYGARLHTTREPSTGPIGRHLAGPVEGLQLDPAALALLFAADRLDHLRREIEPRLANGIHVVSDRYLMSSLAYQTLGVERERVAAFNALATPPDLTIFVEVPIEVSEARRAARGGDAEIFEKRPLQERIRTTYLDEVARLRAAGEPIVVVHGARSIDEVFADVLSAAESCMAAPARQSRQS
jgi:dTMP kinase